MKIWQVSGGPLNRDYVGIFIRYGIALIGPGDSGYWSPQRSAMFEDDFVRRFVQDIEVGDILLLRSGISSIRAVGIVASDYQYLSQFDDVNGWDLQHARRVRWFELPNGYDFGNLAFGANPARFSRINTPHILDYALAVVNSPPDRWKTTPLPALPVEDPPLDRIPDTLSELVAQVNDLASLYLDAHRFGELPPEDELLTHYIIPFLRALGWPVERIGVKWRYVDVTAFSALPRTPENVQFIIEAKRLGAGVEGALDQALGYLKDLGIQCDVIVTDGIRYRLFSAEMGFAPTAYANLARLKQPALKLFELMKRP